MRAINPATGELIAIYPEHDAAAVEQALALAAETFASWRRVPVAHRCELMAAAAAVLRRDAERLARLMTDEMGKVIREARAEVAKCAWVCEYYAEQTPGFLAPAPVASDAAQSFVRFDPLGPVLAVMPWNFPLWQVFRFIAPALTAGNVGLLKHASNVPGCALAIEGVLRQAGFPEGAFQTLLIGSAPVSGIIADPRVAAVTLTGSEPAGRAVGRAAGDAIKPSVLELGGSDPLIVLADADLDHAVAGAVLGRMINSGQSCIAAKRFIVEGAVYDAFVQRLTAALGALKVGDPRSDDTDIGPLARPEFVAEIHDQVRRSIAQGARCVLGGEAPEGPGCFYPPTLLADVTDAMAAFREETFGPVAVAIRASDADHAIALANDSEFGLGASIWTDMARGISLAPRIDAGHVAINGIVKSDPRLPFGGVKRSGYGRELARYGQQAFMNVKAVWAGPA